MKIAIGILFYLGSMPGALSQPCDIASTIFEAQDFLEIGNFDNALQTLEEQQNCLGTTDLQNSELLILKSKAQRGRRKYQKAFESLKEAKSLIEDKDQIPSFELRFLLAEIYGHLGKPTQHAKWLKTIEDSILSQTHVNNSLLGRYYLTKFRVSDKGAHLEEALNNLQKALSHFDKLEVPPIHYYANTLRSLGNMHRNAGDFETSNFYYLKGLEFLTSKYPSNQFDVAYFNYNIGAVYYEKMEYENALDHFLEARKVWVAYLEPADTYMRYLNEAIGDMYWELKDPENALLYFNYSIIDEDKVDNDSSKQIVSEADSLLQKGEYSSAMSYYEKAYAWREKTYGKQHSLTGACKNFVARALRSSGNIEESLNAYQEALIILVEDFKDTNWSANPSLDMKIVSYQYLLESLMSKGELLRELYTTSGNIDDLMASSSTMEVALKILDKMKNGRMSEASQLFWTQKALSLIENYIDTSLTLYNETKEEIHINNAFNTSELSKALLLSASLNEQSNISFINISEELLEKERSLKKNITEYMGRLESEEKRCAEVRDRMLFLYKEKLSKLQKEYDLLLVTIQEKHPEYFQLKYGAEKIDILRLQHILADEQKLLISYFMGIKSTFVFSVSDMGIKTRTIKNSDLLKEEVSEFFDLIRNKDGFIEDPQGSYEKYIASAHHLYTQLLAPELADISTQRLVIIPDGVLSYIPFETLLQEKVMSSERNYQHLPYLIKKSAISYGPSASLLLNKNSSQINDNYLGFAPVYKGSEYANSRQVLQNLKHNSDEVTFAKELFKGKSYVGADATEENLLNEVDNAGILHLAMHGDVEDSSPLLSRLFFYPSKTNDGILHTYEVYNMEIPSQIVILSACNTGTGKLQRGEGILSLERAFQYAGSKALLSTLWKVDDKVSSKLNTNFLQNISEGQDKAIALQNAKLEFLNTASPEKQTPFYWSSFKITGDTSPLKKNRNLIFYLFGAGILLVISIIIFARKSRNTTL